jgi:hypothetical protein
LANRFTALSIHDVEEHDGTLYGLAHWIRRKNPPSTEKGILISYFSR